MRPRRTGLSTRRLAITASCTLALLLGSMGCGTDEPTEPPPTDQPIEGPVSYEQARAIVIAEVEPGWETGTFCLDDRQIGENDELYVFNVGAREYIVDGDLDYALAGGVPVVHKEDGRLEFLASSTVATDDSIEYRDNPDATEPLCG